MNIISNYKIDLSEVLLRFYKFSRSINIIEILSFGLIFYGLSIFLNRPTASTGIFGTMENMTSITQEAWAVIIVSTVILIRLNLCLAIQLTGIIGLLFVMSIMWVIVWRSGLAWQGVVTYSLCVLACVKTSVDDIIAHVLIRLGRL